MVIIFLPYEIIITTNYKISILVLISIGNPPYDFNIKDVINRWGGGFAKRWSYLISLFSKSDDEGGGGSKIWWRLLWTAPNEPYFHVNYEKKTRRYSQQNKLCEICTIGFLRIFVMVCQKFHFFGIVNMKIRVIALQISKSSKNVGLYKYKWPSSLQSEILSFFDAITFVF